MKSILGKYSNLKQRIIAAVFGAFLILGSVNYSQWSYFVIFLLISVITQLEFYKLTGLDGMLPLKSVGTATGLLVYTISFMVERGTLTPDYYLLIFPAMASIFFIKLY